MFERRFALASTASLLWHMATYKGEVGFTDLFLNFLGLVLALILRAPRPQRLAWRKRSFAEFVEGIKGFEKHLCLNYTHLQR